MNLNSIHMLYLLFCVSHSSSVSICKQSWIRMGTDREMRWRLLCKLFWTTHNSKTINWQDEHLETWCFVVNKKFIPIPVWEIHKKDMEELEWNKIYFLVGTHPSIPFHFHSLTPSQFQPPFCFQRLGKVIELRQWRLQLPTFSIKLMW